MSPCCTRNCIVIDRKLCRKRFCSELHRSYQQLASVCSRVSTCTESYELHAVEDCILRHLAECELSVLCDIMISGVDIFLYIPCDTVYVC